MSILYLWLIYQNLGADFCAPKSGYQSQKGPVFSPGLYNDSTKRPKPQNTELGISKIYAFCQNIPLGTMGQREHCWCYVSAFKNTPEKLVLKSIFPLKAVLKIMAGQHSLTVATAFVTAERLSGTATMTTNI